MGGSSSRHRPQQQQQEQQQQDNGQQQQQTSGPYAPFPQQAGAGGYTNGQYFGGYAPPQQQYWRPQSPVPLQPGMGPYTQPPVAPPSGFGQPQQTRPPVQTHEYHQTATIKNQVNLKKDSLKVEPLPGRPHEFALKFTLDATAPCRVTTFLLATESPRDGCRITSAVLGAPLRTPVKYNKGINLAFPPEGDAAAAEAHVISSIRAPLGHMMLASGDSFPLVIRLESLTEEGREQGHTLDELEVGGPFPLWTQAQTTYAKLKQDEDGDWQVCVLKQKIWFKGVSYELQEIYGMEGAGRKTPTPQGQGGPGSSYDELEGRECVVCMCSERDTMVLPCRHMCMCQECAAALKTKTNKCPICRNEISSLLHIKMRRKSTKKRSGGGGGEQAAPAPAAGASSSAS